MNAQKKNLLLISIFSLIFIVGVSLPFLTHAADDTGSGFEFIPQECTGNQGPDDPPCDLNSFVNLFVNLAQVALKVLPFLAMLMMIWAGFNLITAGGSPEKIQQGKKMVTSVVIGVVIVIFLAWGFAAFVVSTLTCNPQDLAAGKTCLGTVFPGYGTPFEKDWWGGGEANPKPPNSGCCVVEFSGCKEVTQTECTSWSTLYDDEVQFMGENVFCSEAKAVCENYTKGCCVPNDPTEKTCYWPDAKTGCIPYPTTQHDPTACKYLGQKCDKDKIQGEGTADEGVTGCCVQLSTCSMTKIGDCQSGGTFLQGKDCSTSDEGKDSCGSGCCIGKNSCTKGKVGCDSKLWDPQECSSLTNDCETNCCVQDPGGNNNCYDNTTRSYCGSVLQGNTQAVPCSSVPVCTNGCCAETCTPGNIDGACTDYTYVSGTACNVLPECQGVCCLYANSLSCSSNILTRDCQDAGDVIIPGGAQCPTATDETCEQVTCLESDNGTCLTKARRLCVAPDVINPGGGLCDTGCCFIPNDVACHDQYTRDQCGRASGTFSHNTSCSKVDNCNGCCVKKHDTYSCSESWTRGQCTADNVANTFYPGDKCTDVTEAGQKVCTVGCCHYCLNNDCVANPDICTMLSTQQYCSTRGPVVEFVPNDPACYVLRHREINPIQCDVVNSN
ncbi:MAG: pilin [Patescibacteria group bacterium]